ncbi:MAG: AlpA family transcriptional regulator [Spongiibacteraceae bacterium]|nr:AlpA family transcriptional regulator [Spongiibacteraceae bacterium]
MTTTTPTEDRILRLSEVVRKSGLCKSAIYDAIQKETFPKQIKLSTRASGWLDSEINQWIEGRINASRRDTPLQKQKRGVA